MTHQEISRAIITGGFTNDQLNTIVDAIKFARSQIVQQNTGSMVVGTRVKFTNNKTGRVIVGQVEKVNRKYIMVREAASANFIAMMWRVPASMLTVA